MSAEETTPDVARVASELYSKTFSRRQLFQYALGVVGAVLVQDQVEGSEALGLSPVMQDWSTSLSRMYAPSTYVTLMTGFNNKTGNRMRERTSETVNEYGRYTRLWPGALVEDTERLWRVMEDMYRKDGHVRSNGTIDYANIRQLFIGHSQGGLPVLQLAGVARDHGVEVPHTTLLATPYNRACVVKDKAWLQIFGFLDDHGLHFGPRARYVTEFVANLTNGESFLDSERMAHNSAWGKETLPNQMLIAQGADIQRERRRIPPVLATSPSTCINYVGAPHDPVVDCERSFSLFRQEVPDVDALRYSVTNPPSRARHAGFDDTDASQQILEIMTAAYAELGLPRASILATIARQERINRSPI